MSEQIAQEIEAEYCPMLPDGHTARYFGDLGCKGTNADHCDIVYKLAAIARGEVKE